MQSSPERCLEEEERRGRGRREGVMVMDAVITSHAIAGRIERTAAVTELPDGDSISIFRRCLHRTDAHGRSSERRLYFKTRPLSSSLPSPRLRSLPSHPLPSTPPTHFPFPIKGSVLPIQPINYTSQSCSKPNHTNPSLPCVFRLLLSLTFMEPEDERDDYVGFGR